MDSLFGLPAHPLVVHAAVVLVPLTAIGTVLSAVWPAARRRIGWITVGFAAASLIACQLAVTSGESLEEQVGEANLVERHAGLGDSMHLFAFLLLLGILAVMLFDLWRQRSAASPATRPSAVAAPAWVRPLGVVISVLAVLAAVGATVRIAYTGHSGAEATWSDVQEQPAGGGGSQVDDDD
ncbi:MAG: hypothetical protein IPM45_13960 [Acidimicrobiales bacterium]|nr:hypothetical protein [Acidimicrobiales bacterium]